MKIGAKKRKKKLLKNQYNLFLEKINQLKSLVMLANKKRK